MPWKLVKSWACLACGRCCRRYSINLSWKEYEHLNRFWPDKVKIKNKRPYLKKRRDGRCVFLQGKLCSLQMLKSKPFACKLWPFKILSEPDEMDKDFEGLYLYRNKEYFVYINPQCSGINRGNPRNLKKAIQEVISIWSGSKRAQIHSTSQARSQRYLHLPQAGEILDT
ncbi:MAG: YkgJ family cysteine cluster protein [Candidatus Aminicenantes bacterium]